jgi:ribosomal-protein-alanine N-acetyltransferase
MMQMRLLAQTTDANLLSHLHAQCFAEAWSGEYIASLLEQAAIFALIAEDGFVLVRVAADESEVLSLGVTPAARRRGVGSQLLAAALDEARRRGATVMFLEVGEGNSPAIALYKRHGFNQVGCRKAYYRAPGRAPEDALLFRVDIAPVTVGNGVQLG